MESFLHSREALESSHGDLETRIARDSREANRLLLQGHLELRAELEQRTRVCGADGVRRGYARPSDRPLTTVFGSVRVLRLAYQRSGVEGLHPLDGTLNLPEEAYSHGLRRLAAEHAAGSSFEATQSAVERSTEITIGKRQLEELVSRGAVDFDEFYRSRPWSEESVDDLLVLSFDGKGIVMRSEDLRAATRKAADSAQHKLASRLSKGEKRNRKRMAEVATVYSLPRWVREPMDVLAALRPVAQVEPRPKPYNKRIWASVQQDARQVIWAGFQEALRRDPQRRRRWVVLVDGNKDQLRAVRRAARRARVDVIVVLDLIHVLEYLWTAAYCFHAEGTQEAERWVEQRLMALLDGRSGGYIAKGMRRLADAHDLQGNDRKPVDDCARYLTKNSRLLHYDRALAEGFPMGTGVVEGACRHLVKRRMDAARWSLAGAEAVLRLRALVMSGDFDEYWTFHLAREHARNHASRYVDNVVPLPAVRRSWTPTLLKSA